MICELSTKPVIFPEEQPEEVRPVGNTTIEFVMDLLQLAFLNNLLAQSNATYSGLPVEMTDREMLVAAEQSGAFEFWKDAEEDGYNDMVNE